jgi:DNA-binding NarL/FixJ family response regulator
VGPKHAPSSAGHLKPHPSLKNWSMVHIASQATRAARGVSIGLSENEGMKAAMYVSVLSPVEQAEVKAGLRSSNAFTLRRSQILLASSRGQRPKEIAQNLGCATQTVRNAIWN